ncbi:hypothetical protein C8R45DRAFT_365442 [Mycena sanguinolenta]|nr:hypothetical protein C8R45DRAFT_365442 [Mycena sanguinolenta]
MRLGLVSMYTQRVSSSRPSNTLLLLALSFMHLPHQLSSYHAMPRLVPYPRASPCTAPVPCSSSSTCSEESATFPSYSTGSSFVRRSPSEARLAHSLSLHPTTPTPPSTRVSSSAAHERFRVYGPLASASTSRLNGRVSCFVFGVCAVSPSSARRLFHLFHRLFLDCSSDSPRAVPPQPRAHAPLRHQRLIVVEHPPPTTYKLGFGVALYHYPLNVVLPARARTIYRIAHQAAYHRRSAASCFSSTAPPALPVVPCSSGVLGR